MKITFPHNIQQINISSKATATRQQPKVVDKLDQYLPVKKVTSEGE
ncbi:hypothetical protein MKX47_18820 [Solibacillus sp. FSL R7-0668]